jgi:hypothetical protein
MLSQVEIRVDTETRRRVAGICDAKGSRECGAGVAL